MTDPVDIDELLSGNGPALTRTRKVEIGGVDFIVREFPAAAMWELTDEITRQSTDEDMTIPEKNRFYAGVVVRFLRGHKHQATEGEIDALMAALGANAINRLFEAGLNFSVDEVIPPNDDAD